MNVKIKDLPEYTVAYTRTVGAYSKINFDIGLDKLTDWAGPKGFFKEGKIITIYCDDPESIPPAQCRIDTCITIPENTRIEDNAQFKVQVIPQGRYAVCNCELPETEFTNAWQTVFSWILKNDFKCDEKPHFEIYYNDPKDHSENKFIVDICIPVK